MARALERERASHRQRVADLTAALTESARSLRGIADYAYVCMIASGRAMDADEVAEAIEQVGYVWGRHASPHSSRRATVQSSLGRDDRFRRVGPYRFALAERLERRRPRLAVGVGEGPGDVADDVDRHLVETGFGVE